MIGTCLYYLSEAHTSDALTLLLAHYWLPLHNQSFLLNKIVNHHCHCCATLLFTADFNNEAKLP